MDALRRTATNLAVGVLGAVFDLLALVAHPPVGCRGYAVRPGMAYGRHAQKLDLFVPKNPRAHAPVVVFFYGGSWEGGARWAYRFVGRILAAAGLTVAIPDYRRYPEVSFPGFVEDGAEAVAWAWHNLAGLENGRLFVAGHSAGAHIAALLTLDRRYLAAAGVSEQALAGGIGLSGPYDFLPLRNARYEAIFPEAVRDASQPVNFVTGDEPPMLLAAGDADRTVEPGNTVRLAARIRERGGRVTEKLYPGVGHAGTIAALVPFLPWRRPPVLRHVLDFIATAGRTKASIG